MLTAMMMQQEEEDKGQGSSKRRSENEIFAGQIVYAQKWFRSPYYPSWRNHRSMTFRVDGDGALQSGLPWS
jgi:hypothetical protein